MEAERGTCGHVVSARAGALLTVLGRRPEKQTLWKQ